jgi:hypothetical protein
MSSRSDDPRSRTVVNPAISVRRANSVLSIATCGIGFLNRSSSSFFQSALPSLVRWVWASISPGISVALPRSMTSAPAGSWTRAPAAVILPSWTTTTPGDTT